MSRAHSILPASSCERWWNCPGSVVACKDIPNPPNKYMAEGTVAHAIAEEALKDRYKNLDSLIGTVRIQEGFEIEVTEEMIDAVIEYKSYVLQVWNDAGRPPILLEQKIELTEVNAVLFGRPDCIIVIPFKVVHIFDFKYGQGKRVSAWQNKQLLEYALGVMLKEDCSSFVLHICQPRLEDGVTKYEGTATEIEQFHVDLKAHAEAALTPNAPLIPGDWCKESFCPYRMMCPALHNLARDLTVSDFSAPAVVNTLSIDHIIKILKYEDTVKDWMARVRDHAKELMLQGEQIPGYKVVASIGHAKWIDEEGIIAEFGDEFGDKLYEERKVLSPSQFEKLVGKKKLGKTFRDDYTVRPQNGFKIVEENEKGEALKTIKPQEDFDVEKNV
jgi:hypothetical protein